MVDFMVDLRRKERISLKKFLNFFYFFFLGMWIGLPFFSANMESERYAALALFIFVSSSLSLSLPVFYKDLEFSCF